jgi:hypothetical protein
MSEAKHTDGPWIIGKIDGPDALFREDAGGYRIDGGGQTQLAYVWNQTSRTSDGEDISYYGSMNAEADARLIAAAPDLLAACEEFAASMRHGDKPDMLALVRALHKADAGIAKAKGE